MPQAAPSNVSLYSNLKLCLVPLSKLYESYGTVKPIADGLKKLIASVELCQKLCVNEDSEDAYEMVLDRLTQATANDHTLLQIYCSRSPFWEHYDRNMAEIVFVLERTVNERQQQDPSLKFQRRFLPLSACMCHSFLQGLTRVR